MATLHIEERVVRVVAADETLEGNLSLPDDAQGIVVFVHGSGSSRHSPSNRYVARILNDGGLATLLVDLLTEDEEAIDMLTADLRFDIELLSQRVIGATDWLKESGYPGSRHWLLRRKHRRCRGAGRSGRAPRCRASRRFPRRPP